VRFEDLKVYRRAAVLSDALRSAVAQWDSFDLWTVGVHLVRAADSIGANIAEGRGRRTDADRLRMLFIARGSQYELEHWLLRARQRGLAVPDGALDEARQIGRMLNGLAARWRP
jgi:four helix bundle protein